MHAIILPVLALVVSLLAGLRAWLDHRAVSTTVEDLRNKLSEANRRLERRSNLANEVAHEIKNPITAILCSAEALDLLVGEQIGEMHRQSLRYIREYGDNLLRLVSDFLDLSRAEAGHLSAKPTRVKVADSFQSIVGLLESNAIQKKQNVRRTLEHADLSVQMDPRHFKQVVFNLLHNAIKFTPPNGQIEVSATRDAVSGKVSVSVQDNGPGIPKNELQRVFDLYARYEGNQPTHDAGSGLGLALCKSLVELAGGSISVESEFGKGATFSFTVPGWKGVELPTAASTNDSSSQPLAGQQFLVVDEDVGARESVAKLIEAWGGIVDKVDLAVDAVEALTKKEYDAVMVDDTKDGIYGHELARILRKDLDGKSTTIIVASKHTLDSSLARESGADRVVEKPLNGDVLLESLLHSGKFTVTH